jgi:hypothetical protein
MGGENGRPFGPSEVEEAISLFRFHLCATTAAEWFKRGIGYGDRFRAIVAIRHKLKRMQWRERFADSGAGRKASRRYRSYVASMSGAEPSPARLAEVVELASLRGVRGRKPGRGRPSYATVTPTAAEAREAIIGRPNGREFIIGPRMVAGGVANVETDGKMKEVEVGRTNFLFFTGKRVGGKWKPDGKCESMVEIDTAYRMVRHYSEVTYPAAVVADAVDDGEWTAADTAAAVGK